MRSVAQFFRSEQTSPPLPDTFLFGVGNSAHQVEGFDPRYEDIRDVWDRRLGILARGRGTEFETRYAQDIELARQMNCKVFRISVAWSRIEPQEGVVNQEALDLYKQIVQAIVDAGMEPMVTLLHFAWPLHVEARGGLLADDFPALFAQFAQKVVGALGDMVRYWITINEPNILVFGFIKPWWQTDYTFPPGMPPQTSLTAQLDAIATLMRNMFLAHTAARTVIKTANPAALVSANPSILGLPQWVQDWINRNAANLADAKLRSRQGRRFAARALRAGGSADMVIASLTRTEERQRHVDYSQIYFVAGQALLTKPTSAINSAADLPNKRLAVVEGSTAATFARLHFPQTFLTVAADYDAALKALDFAEADAVMSDNTILFGLMRRFPNQYRLLDETLDEEPYGVGVARGNPDLLNAVDLAISDFIDSGAWEASFKRNFPELPFHPLGERQTRHSLEVSPSAQAVPEHAPMPLAESGSLLRALQDRGRLRVAVKANVPGLSQFDAQTNTWSGFEIDLARAIAGWIFGDESKIDFQTVETPKRLNVVQSITRFFDPLLKLYGIVSSGFLANWWYLGMKGELPTFLCPRECVGQLDFVGFDYYWGISSIRLDRIQRLADSLSFGRYERAPVWSGAMYNILKWHGEQFPDKPILIVENGCVQEADGVSRDDYLKQHVAEVQRAVQDGINVAGYVCWTLTSNREWGTRLFDRSNDFGLYFIDLDGDPELNRIPTPSVETYRQIIARHGVE